MRIQTQVSQRANREILKAEPIDYSKKSLIEAGVDSHNIEFHLESTQTEIVKKVVDASFDSPINNDFLTGLESRLKELATSGATLVSFVSTTSFEHLAQPGKSIPLRRNSTSLIERIRASLTPNHGNGLTLSAEAWIRMPC